MTYSFQNNVPFYAVYTFFKQFTTSFKRNVSYRKLQKTCLPWQFSTHTLSNNHFLNFTLNLLNSNHILYIVFTEHACIIEEYFVCLSEYTPLAVAFILGIVFGCVINIFLILFCRNRYLDTYVCMSMKMRKANDSRNVPC